MYIKCIWKDIQETKACEEKIGIRIRIFPWYFNLLFGFENKEKYKLKIRTRRLCPTTTATKPIVTFYDVVTV